MRILIITEYMPQSDRAEITGGVEAYSYYITQHLSRNHDVQVISRPSDGSVWDDASLLSIPGRLWFLVRALLEGLRRPADVIVGTTYVVQPVAWLIAKLRRRRIVFWYPDVLIGTWTAGGFGKAAGLIGEIAERVILRLPVDRFIAISESTADKLERHGIPRSRISVIPCGFERALVDRTVAEPTSGRQLIVVGRLVPYKRVDVVVKALSLLHRKHPDVRLVVIGQGPESTRLERLIRDLGLTHQVELRGFVERHSDVLAAIAGSSVLVSASEIEGFGIVVAEAMALGVPYAVSDIPAFREVTAGGRGGRLFEPGEPSALADALDEILNLEDGRQSLIRDGVSHADQYDWANIASRTAEVLDEVLVTRKRDTASSDTN